MEQQIRFCRSVDGVQLAYATHGAGPTMVKAANWVTHVEFDWDSPLWRHWWRELGQCNRLVRYDIRGSGLSDRNPGRLSLEAFVEDLEAVVDAARPGRFALLGISQGGAAAIAYAVRQPGRVSHLVLCGAYARGRMRRELSPQQREEAQLLQSIVRVGWGKADPEFRRVFTTRFVPDASTEQVRWFDDIMRVSASAEMAYKLREVWGEVDVTELLEQVSVPTLVAHARGDRVVPFEEGRLIAARIPQARFLPLETHNHVILASEPAWQVFVGELRAFLGQVVAPAPVTPSHPVSMRERAVLELVAGGLSNEEIAERLSISARTVERHLSNIYAKFGITGKAARAAAVTHFLSQPGGS